MINAFYTAASGVSGMQKGMDVLANNMANVSTNGFKRGETTFADLLYTNIHASETDTNLKTGHGSKLNKIDVLHTQAGLQPTGAPYDFAIVGDGYFAVESNEGIKYTRAGNFHLSIEDDEKFLVNNTGAYVLDADGERITVENEDDELNPAVWKFENKGGLLIEGGLLFNETDLSGVAEVAENDIDYKLVRRNLELSNVDMAQSMSDMIEIQRAFQFNSKMVQTADEVMQTINALRQ